MTDPRAFEQSIARQLEAAGCATELASYTNDSGLDMFATHGAERLAVRVKIRRGVTAVPFKLARAAATLSS